MRKEEKKQSALIQFKWIKCKSAD